MALLLFLSTAGVARAYSSLTITEVMYDSPASDQGHEWIEITNFGSAADVSKYTLFESNTNHKLSVTQGSSILGEGESAIVTQDPTTFISTYPNYSGTIFKASFLLSNSGETLAIKNASSTILDLVTYNSSMGAAGDGASLHRVASGMKPGKPDPGIYSEVVVPLRAPAPPSTAKATPVSATEKSSTTKVADVPAPIVATTEQPAAENNSATLLIEAGLGLLALVVLGSASVWYAKSATNFLVADKETEPGPGEFDIES